MSKRPPSLIRAAQGPKEEHRFSFDRPLHAATARLTAGVSPAALIQAYTDWAQHLLMSPAKQVELAEKAARKWSRYGPICDAPGAYVLEP